MTGPLQPALRVALVATRLDPGGKERVVATLARALRAAGDRAEVVCLEAPGSIGAELAAGGVPVHDLASRPGRDPGAVRRLAVLFRRFRPDVVHVHDRASLPYAVLANRLAGRAPVVLTSHGVLLAGRGRSGRLERFAARRIDAATAVDTGTAAEIAAVLPVPGPVAVVPNAVDPPAARPGDRESARAELGVAEGETLFLAVGNLKPEKGYDVLAAAAALLGGEAVRIAVAGAPEAGRALPESGPCLRFLGARADVPRLLAGADALVLPSRSEAMPLAVLEAMAAGRPVVATAVGAVPEVVGTAGELVPPERPEDLAAAMRRLAGDPLRRAAMGDRGRAAAARFSPASMAAAYRRVYAEAGAFARGDPRPAVVMAGPRPPPVGGMASVMESLGASRLARDLRLSLVDTAKRTRPGRPLSSGIAAQARLALRLAARIRRTGARVVHVHTCSGATFWRDAALAAVARAARARVVLHVHGALFDAFAAGRGPIGRAAIRNAFARAAAVVVTGRGWVDRLRPYAGGARLAPVPNGVPIPAEASPLAGGPVRLLHLGSLEARKGVGVLLDAAGRAAASGLDLRVTVAGPAPGEAEERGLADAIARHGLGGRVDRPGVLTGAAKEAAVRGADVFVLASRGEGLPIALLEAMASGVPPVVTDVGAVPEAVRDGVEGFLVAPGDPAALGDRIGRLARDPYLRRRMGAAARTTAIRRFSVDRMAADLLAVYRRAGLPGGPP